MTKKEKTGRRCVLFRAAVCLFLCVCVLALSDVPWCVSALNSPVTKLQFYTNSVKSQKHVGDQVS